MNTNTYLKEFMRYMMNAPAELTIRNEEIGEGFKVATLYHKDEWVALYVFQDQLFILNEYAGLNLIDWDSK